MVENHCKTSGEHLEFVNKISIPNKISADLLDKFKKLKVRRGYRYLTFKIGTEEIEVEKIGERNATYEEFKSSLPYSECRYAVYDQDYRTHDNRPASKLWFISWLPSSSTTHTKMAYTSAKSNFRESITGVFDLMASSLDQIDEALGLEEEEEEDADSDF